MNVETKAAQTVAQLAGLHEKGEPPTVHEKFAAFWWGEWNEDVPGWLNLCDIGGARTRWRSTCISSPMLATWPAPRRSRRWNPGAPAWLPSAPWR